MSNERPTPSSHPRRRHTLSRRRKLVFGLVVALGILLGLEGMARIAKTVRDDFQAQPLKWYRLSSTLGWDRQPGFRGQVYHAWREFGEHGFVTVDEAKLKHSDRPRVVVLGDSTSFGYMVPTADTYAEQLQRRLPEADVFNLAMIGYSSFQGKNALLKYGLDLNPSLIVVCFNWNDRRLVFEPEAPDSQTYFRKVAFLTSMRRLSRHIYLLRLAGWAFDRSSTGPDPDRLDENASPEIYYLPRKDVPLSEFQARVGPEAYRRNLTEIARLAGERGIPVIFLSFQDSPRHEKPLADAIAQIESGQAQAAADALKNQLDRANVYRVLAAKYRGVALEKLGRKLEAEEARHIDEPILSLHGSEPLYLDAEYNTVMREVAEQTSQTLVDVGSVMIQHPEVYQDFVHFDERGHRIVADLLYPEVERALRKPGRAEGGVMPQ